MESANKKLKKLKTLLPHSLLKEDLHYRYGAPMYHHWRNLLQQLRVMKTVTYVKEQSGNKCTKPKIFGVYWHKHNNTLSVDFKSCKENANSEVTKKSILRVMASVCNPLGGASLMLLVAKQLYRTSDERIAFYKPLPKNVGSGLIG